MLYIPLPEEFDVTVDYIDGARTRLELLSPQLDALGGSGAWFSTVLAIGVAVNSRHEVYAVSKSATSVRVAHKSGGFSSSPYGTKRVPQWSLEPGTTLSWRTRLSESTPPPVFAFFPFYLEGAECLERPLFTTISQKTPAPK